jgi:hypothetical protein
VRHVKVQHHQTGQRLVKRPQGLARIADTVPVGEAACTEHPPEQAHRIGVVIDHEDPRAGR